MSVNQSKVDKCHALSYNGAALVSYVADTLCRRYCVSARNAVLTDCVGTKRVAE